MIERAAVPGLVLGAVVLLLAACQPDAEACCRSDDDCAAGAGCFEGLCAPRCSYDSQCGAGQLCAPGGVCVALGRPKGHCGFLFGVEEPVDGGVAEPGEDAGPDADAGPDTCEDRHEPNNHAEAATRAFGAVERLGICAGDHDYFALDANPGDTLAARIEFSHRSGDLDIELLQGGEQIAVSQGVSDVESLELEAPRAGTYVLHVFGFGDRVENRYELAFTRIPVGDVCVDDAFEDNDTGDQAMPLAIGETVFAALCPSDPSDFFSAFPPPGAPTAITLRYEGTPGLRLSVTSPGEGAVVSESGTGEERLVVTPEAGGEVRIEVSGAVSGEMARGYELGVAFDGELCTDAHEPNDTPDVAPSIPVPVSLEGTTCPGDVDFFRLELEPDRTSVEYSFQAEPGAVAVLLRESDFTAFAELGPGTSGEIDISAVAPSDLLLVVGTETTSTLPYIVDLF